MEKISITFPHLPWIREEFYPVFHILGICPHPIENNKHRGAKKREILRIYKNNGNSNKKRRNVYLYTTKLSS